MRFLVTGGAGFLGSHLCEALLRNHHEVICLDNFYTGSRKNVEHLQNNPKFELIEHDVLLPIQVEVDAIMNLACPASPIQYQKHPVQTIKTSVLGAINVLELANRLGVPVFQASTSEVYGDPSISPQVESYWGNVNPTGIRACYDEGKRASETLFFDFNRQYNLPIKVVRIFNTYGPRMDLLDGRVVSNFIVQALRNEPITIYGNGMQTRSFCFVSDLIEAFILTMNTDSKVTGPINLGNPREFTIVDLATIIIELTNSNSILNWLPLPADDPKQRKPDITMARTTLGWEPKVDLETGLRLTINDLSSRLGKS